jgi:hypothetical protein
MGENRPQSRGMLLSSLLCQLWLGMETRETYLSHNSILYYRNMRDQELKTFLYVSKVK